MRAVDGDPAGGAARASRHPAFGARPLRARRERGRAVRPRPLRDVRVHPGLSLWSRHAGGGGVVARVRPRPGAARAHRTAFGDSAATTGGASQAVGPRRLCRLQRPHPRPAGGPRETRSERAGQRRRTSGLRLRGCTTPRSSTPGPRTLPQSAPRTEGLTPLRRGPRQRPGDVPGGPAAQDPAAHAGAPEAGDHRLRATLERHPGAPVPGRRVAQLRQAPLGAASRAAHSGDAPGTDRRALGLEAAAVTPPVLSPTEAPRRLVLPLPPPLDHTRPSFQYPPRPGPGVLVDCLLVELTDLTPAIFIAQSSIYGKQHSRHHVA